uniref:Uncharacterized protein n=1 Tax=Melanopsichium pennsylvanicum 4 TaxID=1398559 RepID=A0A077RE37_9BASI|nr:putative protein [Melanopsichium pennsylvanicum 4]
MSFSTAFHSLRFPARSIAVSQLPRILALPTGSRTSSNISYGRRSPHSTRKTVPHAPHRHLDEAGPSRCFCTSHSNNKASELPLEELHYESSLDNYRHAQLSTSKDYWQFANTSSSTTSRFDAEPRTQSRGRASTSIHYDFAQSIPIRNLLSEAHQSSSQEQQQQQQQQQQQIHAPANDFFTPSVEQRPNQVKRAETVPDRIQSFTSPALQKSYIGSLNAIQRDALDSRVMVLIRSGERSMAALSAVYGELTAQEREQVCCSIMTHCIKHSDDPRFIFDLYRSWSSTIHIALDVPPGSTRTMIRRMQSDTLYLCATFLHRAGLIRQAARVVGDSRLKPSQSRYLLERLIYDLKLSPTLHTLQRQFKMSDTTDQLALHPSATFITTDTFAAVDARLAAREICDTMMNLMADGLSFRRKAINRTLKILCLTRARSRIVRLLRAAQRRAQIDLLVNEAGVHGGQSGELRTAGGFSRLRTEQVKPPQVVSTKVMEGAMRVLCAQGSLGARTAYELLSALDPLQRSATMYDALMTVYGNASIGPVSPTESGVTTLQLGSSSAERYLTVDEQLWTDMCSLSHLSGPTLQTISARIVCHARTRNLELIKCDLAYLRSSKLGTLHDLTNKAKLSIARF